MNSFDTCRKVENKSIAQIIQWLDGVADEGRVVRTDKGRLSEFLQRSAGDALAQCNGKVYGVEIKTETKWTGNLFLETWSNKHRGRPGWLFTLNADMLLYHFSDRNVLYSIPFQRLQRWAEGLEVEGWPENFVERQQRKYDQMNDTWGRCVPVEAVLQNTGGSEYSL